MNIRNLFTFLRKPVDWPTPEPIKLEFAASSILGAKSLAYQQGIGVHQEPVFKHHSGGIWTLVYEVEA